MATYQIEYPYEEKEIRRLRIGDIVYVTGVIHTMRDMGYRRALDYLEEKRALPVELSEGAIWHCGPVVACKDGSWIMVSAGSTTSSRFTALAASMTELLNIRITLGKGTLGPEAAGSLSRIGSCYLATAGGCAALYTQRIERVLAANWLDLGYPEALWSLSVKNFGPLTVGVDSTGAILYESIREKTRQGFNEAYRVCNLPVDKTYSFWPKRVPASTPFRGHNGKEED